MRQSSDNILSQQTKNQKFKNFYSELYSITETSIDLFSDLLHLKKRIDALEGQEKKALTKSIQVAIEKMALELSRLDKVLSLAKEDVEMGEIMSQIYKFKILHESLEMLLMSEEQIENIRQTSRRFQKKAQSSVVPEKYLK